MRPAFLSDETDPGCDLVQVVAMDASGQEEILCACVQSSYARSFIEGYSFRGRQAYAREVYLSGLTGNRFREFH